MPHGVSRDPQPRRGARRTDAQGRVWVKTRTLPRDEWLASLLDAHFDMRTQRLDDESVRRMGFSLEE